MDERDWAGAIKLFEQIEQTQPGYRDTNNLLKQAQAEIERQASLAALFTQGKEQLSKRKWTEAISSFRQALASDPGNVEAQALLAEAEKGQKVEEAELQIKQEQEQREREAAEQRQAQLAKAEKGKKVNDLFDTALRHMRVDEWPEAIAKFQAVLEFEPDHSEAKAGLAEARIKLERQEEDKVKKMAESEKPSPLMMKPASFPEVIKQSRPSSVPEKIQPSKPGTLPEESKPRRKPKDLPK
jgi:tetratricopeptide (TPR) repeat protein